MLILIPKPRMLYVPWRLWQHRHICTCRRLSVRADRLGTWVATPVVIYNTLSNAWDGEPAHGAEAVVGQAASAAS